MAKRDDEFGLSAGSLSKRKTAQWRRESSKVWARQLRESDRKKLAQLKTNLKHAKRLKGERVREVKLQCKAARVRYKATKKVLRAQLARDIAAAYEREQLASRTRCDAQIERVRLSSRSGVERAARVLELERERYKNYDDWDTTRAKQRRKDKRKGYTVAKQLTAAERRAESDDEVRNNLEPEHVPVWNAYKHKIRGNKYRSRTEAFLEWMHDHPADAEAVMYRRHDEEIDHMEAHEDKLRKRLGDKAYWAQKQTEYEDATAWQRERMQQQHERELDAVPF